MNAIHVEKRAKPYGKIIAQFSANYFEKRNVIAKIIVDAYDFVVVDNVVAREE